MNYIVKKLKEGKSKCIDFVIKIISVSTVVYYILHSFIKRFAENQKLQFIPFVLFIINSLVLFEILLLVKQKKIDYASKNLGTIIFQIILNLSFSIFIFYFYLK